MPSAFKHYFKTLLDEIKTQTLKYNGIWLYISMTVKYGRELVEGGTGCGWDSFDTGLAPACSVSVNFLKLTNDSLLFMEC